MNLIKNWESESLCSPNGKKSLTLIEGYSCLEQELYSELELPGIQVRYGRADYPKTASGCRNISRQQPDDRDRRCRGVFRTWRPASYVVPRRFEVWSIGNVVALGAELSRKLLR